MADLEPTLLRMESQNTYTLGKANQRRLAAAVRGAVALLARQSAPAPRREAIGAEVGR